MQGSLCCMNSVMTLVVNTGDVELLILCMATMLSLEVGNVWNVVLVEH
jgi:hypothetical protein